MEDAKLVGLVAALGDIIDPLAAPIVDGPFACKPANGSSGSYAGCGRTNGGGLEPKADCGGPANAAAGGTPYPGPGGAPNPWA